MLEFKSLESSYPGKGLINYMKTMRAKVPGGWLVVVAFGQGEGVAFVPDPTHEWDGNSLV